MAIRKRILILLVAGLGLAACSSVSSSPGGHSNGAVQPRANNTELPAEQLSAQGEQLLRKVIQGGTPRDLQSADFFRHPASVKKFYEETNYSLG